MSGAHIQTKIGKEQHVACVPSFCTVSRHLRKDHLLVCQLRLPLISHEFLADGVNKCPPVFAVISFAHSCQVWHWLLAYADNAVNMSPFP